MKCEPPELHVDDAGMAELVVETGLGHGAERGAAEVQVVPGHRVVVHVGDHHRLRRAGAGRVILLCASYLEINPEWKVNERTPKH
jgi:mannose-6-phosphate isomerase-like protein (cupin superfamily)